MALGLVVPGPGSGRPINYLAPAGYCTGRWVQVMTCLHGYARRQAGLAPLHRSPLLTKAARAKSADIIGCGFAHTACGHQFEYRIDWAGYRWRLVGENLAWGTGRRARPYAIFSQWIRSPGHRANMLNPRFHDLGIAVRRSAFGGNADAAVWVAEFGRH